MRVILQLVRVIVGLLFIFSGLIKANDPLGLSYKMQEFFELWGITQFNVHTLWLSIVLIAFEIIAGAALILGWKPKINTWLLLLLTLFFTFLTGYALFSGKFKNCGCFGDCIPLTPQQSFIKDIVLTLLVVFLFVNRKNIKPIFPAILNTILVLAVTVFSFAIQWYTLNYLPFFDCLGYKKGKNIPQQMKIPAGARPDSFAIRFIYAKGGKNFEFAPSELPADLASYKYVSRTDKLIRVGDAEPPIKGFSLTGVSGDNADSTTYVLEQPYAVLLFYSSEKHKNNSQTKVDSTKIPETWELEFAALVATARMKNIPVFIVTNNADQALTEFNSPPFDHLQVFTCDYTAIRTAARVDKTVYLLWNGTIIDKQSYRKMELIQDRLISLAIQPKIVGVNTSSKQTILDSIKK